MVWQLDPSHSRIFFSARHMMIATVRGEFEKFDVTFDYDENNPQNTKISVDVDTTSLHTRDEKRDGHLKSPDFLDVENFPVMKFVSKRIELVNDKHAKLVGDLTIRDVTHSLTLDVESAGVLKTPWGATTTGFTASAKINRKDYNLNWNVLIEGGGVLVSDEINLNIEVEFAKIVETAAEAVKTA